MCVVWYIYIQLFISLSLYMYIDWCPSCCKSAESAQTSRFQVKVEALEETLDRFARFFSEPLLTKAPGRHFGCVMGRWYCFSNSCHVLFFAWKNMMTPLAWKKQWTLYHEGHKSKVFFLLFSLTIVEILAVHGKDCTEREINAVDSEFQAGAMTCGKWFVMSVCLRCSRGPWPQCWKKAIFSYVNSVNF